MLISCLALADDQCALNADGMLKDASQIVFYLNADSIMPLAPGPSDAPAGMHDILQSIFIVANILIVAEALRGHGHRHKRTDKLSASLSAEQQDEDGNPILPSGSRKHRVRKAKGKAKAIPDDIMSIDDDDDEYEETEAESDDGDTDASEHEDDNGITNEEVFSLFLMHIYSVLMFLSKLANMLPSKTVPLGG